jgi:hypothetical protein
MTIDKEALRKLAEAATPQDFDSAEIKIEEGWYECQHCNGQGEIQADDYCNYDGVAQGVLFYGIGNEFGASEAYYRAAKPATILFLLSELDAKEQWASEVIEAVAAHVCCDVSDFGNEVLAADIRAALVEHNAAWDAETNRLKNALANLDAKDAEIARLREALEKLASWDDAGGNKYLETFGSYAAFDEPNAAQISRAALSQKDASHE